MLGRHYILDLARFGSVDPARDGWNLYGYVGQSPMIAIDPDGLDLKIVFDFSETSLSPETQQRIALGVGERFRNAGVENVQLYFPGGSVKPTEEGPSDRVVSVSFVEKDLKQDLTAGDEGAVVYGFTPLNSRFSTVSTNPAPSGDAGIRLLVNVTAHEIGHASDALPQYAMDGNPYSPLYKAGEQGTIMDQGVDVDTLSSQVREFSAKDAAALRERLNRANP
jgi:hypothetical protein